MKYLVAALLMALLSFALGLYFPWWIAVSSAFLIGLAIKMQPGLSFLTGFLAIGLLWGVMAGIINDQNGGILAEKMSMLILKKNNPFLLVLLTALIGGITGGLCALTGSLLKNLLTRK